MFVKYFIQMSMLQFYQFSFFPSNTGSSLGSDIAYRCHVSLASFNLEHFHSLCLFDTFEKFISFLI